MALLKSALFGRFGDAAVFFDEFLMFLEASPPASRSLCAVTTIDYTVDFRGETFEETTTLRTQASTVEGCLEIWWRTNVRDPVERFLNRFENGDVVNITYCYL